MLHVARKVDHYCIYYLSQHRIFVKTTNADIDHYGKEKKKGGKEEDLKEKEVFEAPTINSKRSLGILWGNPPPWVEGFFVLEWANSRSDLG